MVAMLDKCGAFIYDISAEEMDKRIKCSKELQKNRIDYDENGEYAKRGMVAWLFQDKGIIEWIDRMRCEAVYIRPANNQPFYLADYHKTDDMLNLRMSYRKIFGGDKI